MIALQTLAGGSFYLLAGLFGLTRHFLLEPAILDYPKTPRWLLRVFFAFSVVMVYAGLRNLSIWWEGVFVSPPGLTSMGVVIAFSIFAYKLSLLVDTCHRKPQFTLDDIMENLRKLGIKDY